MRKAFIPYNPKLVPLARKLRNNMTYGEVKFWKEVKSKKLGYRFHRQKPILGYIADFFCFELMLVIEIDGASHNGDRLLDDKIRQQNIEFLGISVLRFQERDAVHSTEGIILELTKWIEEQRSAHSLPRSRGEGHRQKRGTEVPLYKLLEIISKHL